ncbi:hypothetical protein [Streptomyces violaceus]|uniref:Uncharacterized protein n=1 Tax=Streptomyces violaceus TaxID=1936 RepID=A0ABY9UMB9_STRVL|nr:hypothetical protein [Streptomyces janthinus]WND24054.1 hypothetical protein RI060_42810 [Streptomyces janthinus]GGS96578.1 hypothetical protein GCM10010270_80680 [Streptomyces janthinus]
MYILATAALAAIGNAAWYWASRGMQMPTWLTFTVVFGSLAAVEAALQARAALQRRRARGSRPRRAHARPHPKTRKAAP